MSDQSTPFYRIKSAIVQATESQELVHEDIEPDDGILLANSTKTEKWRELVQEYITPSRESFVSASSPPTFMIAIRTGSELSLDNMLAQGFLTAAEKRSLRTRIGTTLQDFQGPYALSSKEPDLCIRPDAQAKPTIAIESGWSESWPHLHNDMRLWLTGGAPVVRIVILLLWSKLVGNPKRVSGVVEIFERNAAGIPTLIQTESIFPLPAAAAAPQRIPVSRSQLFGTAIFPNRNPNDIFQLSIDELHQAAIPCIQGMGYVPA